MRLCINEFIEKHWKKSIKIFDVLSGFLKKWKKLKKLKKLNFHKSNEKNNGWKNWKKLMALNRIEYNLHSCSNILIEFIEI